MINRDTLDSMLDSWARFYLSEFSSVGWARFSLSGRIIEAAKLGIFSRGTSQKIDMPVSPDILIVANAILSLEFKYQQVIREQYAGRGRQTQKAKRLNITYNCYKQRLKTARQQLTKALS